MQPSWEMEYTGASAFWVSYVPSRCTRPEGYWKKVMREIIEVICDDPETLHDIPALCDRLNVELRGVNEQSGEYRFLIANVKLEM